MDRQQTQPWETPIPILTTTTTTTTTSVSLLSQSSSSSPTVDLVQRSSYENDDIDDSVSIASSTTVRKSMHGDGDSFHNHVVDLTQAEELLVTQPCEILDLTLDDDSDIGVANLRHIKNEDSQGKRSGAEKHDCNSSTHDNDDNDDDDDDDDDDDVDDVDDVDDQTIRQKRRKTDHTASSSTSLSLMTTTKTSTTSSNKANANVNDNSVPQICVQLCLEGEEETKSNHNNDDDEDLVTYTYHQSTPMKVYLPKGSLGVKIGLVPHELGLLVIVIESDQRNTICDLINTGDVITHLDAVSLVKKSFADFLSYLREKQEEDNRCLVILKPDDAKTVDAQCQRQKEKTGSDGNNVDEARTSSSKASSSSSRSISSSSSNANISSSTASSGNTTTLGRGSEDEESDHDEKLECPPDGDLSMKDAPPVAIDRRMRNGDTSDTIEPATLDTDRNCLESASDGDLSMKDAPPVAIDRRMRNGDVSDTNEPATHDTDRNCLESASDGDLSMKDAPPVAIDRRMRNGDVIDTNEPATLDTYRNCLESPSDGDLSMKDAPPKLQAWPAALRNKNTSSVRVEEKSFRKTMNELNSLRDHNNAGLDSHCANPINFKPWECSKCTVSNHNNPHRCEVCKAAKDGECETFVKQTRSKKSFKCHTVSWDYFAFSGTKYENETNTLPFYIPKPIHHTSNPLSSLRKGIMFEFQKRHHHSKCLLMNIEIVKRNTYYKAHLNTSIVRQYYNYFDSILPSGFTLREANNTTSIISFYNEAENTCDTHFDQDPSVLFLLQGIKEIYLAPKRIVNQSNISSMHRTILNNVHPFDNTKKFSKDKDWVKVTMKPGDALYLPKGCVHAIKSRSDTLALSFQVVKNKEGPKDPLDDELLSNFHNYMKRLTKARNKRRSDTFQCNSSKKTKVEIKCKVEDNSASTELLKADVDDSAMNATILLKTQDEEYKVPLLKRQRRKVRKCGFPMCNNGFVKNSVSENMFVLKIKDENDCIEMGLSSVPTHIPKHLICKRCFPTDYQKYIEPSLEFNRHSEDWTLKELEHKYHYCYFSCSLADYKVHAENGGAGNLHQQIFASQKRKYDELGKVETILGGGIIERDSSSDNEKVNYSKKKSPSRTKAKSRRRSCTDGSQEQFEARLMELKQFKDEKSHLRVPKNTNQIELFYYIDSSRRLYKERMRDDKENKLKPKHIMQLAQIGHDFDPKCLLWDEKIEQVQAVLLQSKNDSSILHSYACRNLNLWIQVQLTHYHVMNTDKCTLFTEKKIVMLKSFANEFGSLNQPQIQECRDEWLVNNEDLNDKVDMNGKYDS
jgi:hypothetical protein